MKYYVNYEIQTNYEIQMNYEIQFKYEIQLSSYGVKITLFGVEITLGYSVTPVAAISHPPECDCHTSEFTVNRQL